MSMILNKKLIVANWKNHPNLPSDAVKFWNTAKRGALSLKKTELVVCPPMPFLALLARTLPPKKIFLGAQSSSAEEGGSWTGSIPASMIFEIGARYLLIGHSEERRLGLTDKDIGKRLAAALRAGLYAILCVGESARDTEGFFLSILEGQISSALSAIPRKFLDNLIIAYEPVWAIGKAEREAMNPRDLHETVIFIRKTLAAFVGGNPLPNTPILYGGSVGAHNAAHFISEGTAIGLLVGRGSLETTSFRELLASVDAIK